MKKLVIVLTVLIAVLTSAFAGTTSAAVTNGASQSLDVKCTINENIPKFQLVASKTATGTFEGSDLVYENDALLSGITAYFKVSYVGSDSSKAIRWNKTVTVAASATALTGTNGNTATVDSSVSTITNDSKNFKNSIGKTGDFGSFNVTWTPSNADSLPADTYSATVTVTFTVA